MIDQTECSNRKLIFSLVFLASPFLRIGQPQIYGEATIATLARSHPTEFYYYYICFCSIYLCLTCHVVTNGAGKYMLTV